MKPHKLHHERHHANCPGRLSCYRTRAGLYPFMFMPAHVKCNVPCGPACMAAQHTGHDTLHTHRIPAATRTPTAAAGAAARQHHWGIQDHVRLLRGIRQHPYRRVVAEAAHSYCVEARTPGHAVEGLAPEGHMIHGGGGGRGKVPDCG